MTQTTDARGPVTRMTARVPGEPDVSWETDSEGTHTPVEYGKMPVKEVVYVGPDGQPTSPVALMREWQDAATAALAEWQSAVTGALTNRQSIVGKERERKLKETYLRLQIADLEAVQEKRVNQDWREAQFILLCTNDDEHAALTTEIELLRGNAQLQESAADQARERVHVYRTLLQTLGALCGYF